MLPRGKKHIAASDVPPCCPSLACDPDPNGEPVSTTTCIARTLLAPNAIRLLAKAHVAANGSPAQPRSIVSEKPFNEVSVSVVMLCCCDCNATDEGFISMVNCIGLATTMLVYAEVDRA